MAVAGFQPGRRAVYGVAKLILAGPATPEEIAALFARAGSRSSADPAPMGHCRHTGTMQKMSLTALAREQQELAASSTSGRSARTVWGGHEHVLRQTLIALTAGTSMSEHENPGEATLQVINGRVRLDSGDNQWEGRQGDLLLVPPARHSLFAVENAVVLLTVAKIAEA